MEMRKSQTTTTTTTTINIFFTPTFSYWKIYILLEDIFGKT